MAVSKRQRRISYADREQRSLGLAQVHEWDSHCPRASSPAGDASRMGPEHWAFQNQRPWCPECCLSPKVKSLHGAQ